MNICVNPALRKYVHTQNDRLQNQLEAKLVIAVKALYLDLSLKMISRLTGLPMITLEGISFAESIDFRRDVAITNYYEQLCASAKVD